jgi:hypothetical protein
MDLIFFWLPAAALLESFMYRPSNFHQICRPECRAESFAIAVLGSTPFPAIESTGLKGKERG